MPQLPIASHSDQAEEPNQLRNKMEKAGGGATVFFWQIASLVHFTVHLHKQLD